MARQDSNLNLTEPKPVALPLGHVPFELILQPDAITMFLSDNCQNLLSQAHFDVLNRGFAITNISCAMEGHESDWAHLSAEWDELELDEYLPKGDRYRRRRYGCFIYEPESDSLIDLEPMPFFQSVEINQVAGGIQRNFRPISKKARGNLALRRLILLDLLCFVGPRESGLQTGRWKIGVHQIRVETSGQRIVTPVPEGIHCDGHDFVAMHLVSRVNVAGAQSIVMSRSCDQLASHVMRCPYETMFVDDSRVMHTVEPFRAARDGRAYRDVLIVDLERLS